MNFFMLNKTFCAVPNAASDYLLSTYCYYTCCFTLHLVGSNMLELNLFIIFRMFYNQAVSERMWIPHCQV